MKIILVFVILFLSSITSLKSNEKLIQEEKEKFKHTEKTEFFSIFKTDDNYVVSQGKDLNAIAFSTLISSQMTDGWGKIYITTNKNFDDVTQAFASGYLEGYITQNQIYQQYYNTNQNEYNGKGLQSNIIQFFSEHHEYMENLVSTINEKSTVYDISIKLIWNQFNGIYKGYSDKVNLLQKQNEFITKEEFHMVMSQGDLFEIMYYKNDKLKKFSEYTLEEIMQYKYKNSHCSAIVKVVDNDIYIGHNTWIGFHMGVRFMKSYEFNFSFDEVARVVSFSAFAGVLSSLDDFNITSNQLVVLETTNPVLDNEILKKITPQALLSWERTWICNRLANSPEEWVEMMTLHNSGTYNNQYMIFDNKKYENGILEDKSLMILETLPGDNVITDVTDFLRKNKYWPSYNTPYSAKVRQEFGYFEMEAKYKKEVEDKDYDDIAIEMINSTFNYDNNDRANIFRREHSKIKNTKDFENLLRFNHYKNDEFSLKHPSFSLASRADLDTGHLQSCSGSIDAKYVVLSENKNKSKHLIHAVSGPSDDEDVGPFRWSESSACKNVAHKGIRDLFLFEWINFESNEFSSAKHKEIKFLE